MKRLLVHLQQLLRLLLPPLSMLLMLLVRSVVVRLLSVVPVRQVCLRCLTVAVSVCLHLVPEPRECWTLHLDPCLPAQRKFEHLSIRAA